MKLTNNYLKIFAVCILDAAVQADPIGRIARSMRFCFRAIDLHGHRYYVQSTSTVACQRDNSFSQALQQCGASLAQYSCQLPQQAVRLGVHERSGLFFGFSTLNILDPQATVASQQHAEQFVDCLEQHPQVLARASMQGSGYLFDGIILFTVGSAIAAVALMLWVCYKHFTHQHQQANQQVAPAPNHLNHLKAA